MNKTLRLVSFSLVLALVSCNKTPSLSNLKVSREGGRFTDAQMVYLNRDDYSDTNPYNGNMSVSAPNPIVLSWDAQNISTFKVEVFKGEELVASYQVNKNTFNFYNDEIMADYKFKVSTLDGNLVTEVVAYQNNSYSVPSPRSLYVEGVENIRDLGGWGKIENGTYKRFMKQGMLYRSGRFNADKENPVKITVSDNGIYELKNHLKIKTEVDLRRSSNNEIGSLTSSALGEGVSYYNLPMYYGGNNILTFKGTASGDDYQYDNPSKIKDFFDILAEPNNYPIDFHCSIGKDRTGCMAYLIEGLLGFDQDIMYRDYMFTNFADAGMCKMTDITANGRYGKTLSEYTGDNIQEKVYNYLNEVIGVSTTKLDSIINLLKA